MEKLIESIFKNESKYDNFTYIWKNEYEVKFLEMIPESKNAEVKKQLINTIKLFITKANTIKRYYPNETIEFSLNLEEDFSSAIATIISSAELSELSTKDALDLLKFIVSNKRLKFFMGRCFDLVSNEFQIGEIFEKFNIKDECSTYLKLLEIDFYPLLENEKKAKPDELQKYYNRCADILSYFIESAIQRLNEKQFMACISDVQHLYE